MNRANTAIAVVSLLALLLVSCTERAEQPCQFVVRVDSIAAPDTITTGEDLAVGLWGTIGHDGRYDFSHFEADATDSSLDVTVWGRFTPADYFTFPIVDIRGRQYHTIAGSPGPFAVRVHQPDGSILRDSVAVIQPDSQPPPVPHIARIKSITAPDTVRVREAFSACFLAVLGNHYGYVLDHIDSLRTDSSLAVRVWSRDDSKSPYVLQVIIESDYAFTARAAAPGTYGVSALQPDGSTTRKTIIVLP